MPECHPQSTAVSIDFASSFVLFAILLVTVTFEDMEALSDIGTYIMVAFATSVVYTASRLALSGPARYGIDADDRQSIELTSRHALLLPIAASLALVAMYFLFDSIQAVFLLLHVFVAFYCSQPLLLNNQPALFS